MSEERKPITQEDFITLVREAINTGSLKLIDLELDFEIDLIPLLLQMGIQLKKEDGNTYYIDCPFDIFISNTVFKKPFSIKHQPFIVESAPIENDRYCQAKIRFPKNYIHGLLCSDSVFESGVFLKGITFESGVAFTNVTFNKDASFRENLFKNEIVSFQNVTFKGLLQFTHSKFEGNAYFTNSLIESGVCFGLSSFEKEKEVSFE
ncbi:MAG: pentapeptide repeat-containing protein, partial [Vampirovibrionales bacterium]